MATCRIGALVMNLSSRILDMRPPRIATSLVLAAAFLHYLGPPQKFELPSSPVTAGIIAVCGFAIMLRAWWLFKLRDTAICPTATTTVLITDDVFALSRNPMYFGMLMMLLALAFLFGSLPFYFAVSITVFHDHNATSVATTRPV